jgi:hypothetical protein
MPKDFEQAILWLEEQSLYIHSFWRWNPDIQPTPETKFYCSLSTPRPHVSNKVYAAGRAQTPMAALVAAYENYLNPPLPQKRLPTINKAQTLSLDDLGL